MSDLPADREKALEAIANGWGRTPTRAHPLCVCGTPVPEPQSPPLHTISDEPLDPAWPAYWQARRDWLSGGHELRAKDCPMHRPAGKASRQG